MRTPPSPGPSTVECTAMMACRPTSGLEQNSTRSCPMPAICWKRSIALERRQRREHLGVVAVDVDPLPDPAHLAGAVDEECRALDAHRRLAVQVLLAPGAVGVGDPVAGIGEEREVEAVLVAELAVAGDVVGRNAEHGGAVGGQLGLAVTEGAGLAGASRGVVLRVEVQHDRLAAQGGEPDLLAVVGTQGEVGRALALFDPLGLLGHGSSFRVRSQRPFLSAASPRTRVPSSGEQFYDEDVDGTLEGSGPVSLGLPLGEGLRLLDCMTLAPRPKGG